MTDSREVDDGQSIKRRRSCQGCGRRFTTLEEAMLAVVKRSGVSEPFSRDKVISGVRRACQGRPVGEDQLALLAEQVEDTVRASGAAEVPSNEVGLAILGPLRALDSVAYLRFASVYRSFASVADFEAEIALLRESGAVDRDTTEDASQGQASKDPPTKDLPNKDRPTKDRPTKDRATKEGAADDSSDTLVPSAPS
ncbi:transcriptional regulator NrdR [Antricoccus suffuscus]|uniref:transcriptional regulator NrdR n=1 Tax=Antricoccus suffuscus TaxID=1629062 RepID=UPI001EDCA8E3|nr:transcriptional regulator NrdR [Antricoccus suffuscus]